MSVIPATITAELLEHADGRPIAYIDATGLAVFAYQHPDGSYIIDIYTRDDITSRQLHLLLDGEVRVCTPEKDDRAPAVGGPEGTRAPTSLPGPTRS
jgi:hypothetical protein